MGAIRFICQLADEAGQGHNGRADFGNDSLQTVQTIENRKRNEISTVPTE